MTVYESAYDKGFREGAEQARKRAAERDRLREDVAFLAGRSMNAGRVRFASDRDTGMSSNYIVALAYGVEAERRLPSDAADLAACERMWEKLPEHRKTEVVVMAMDDAREALKGGGNGAD